MSVCGVIDYVLNGEIKGWVAACEFAVSVDLYRDGQIIVSSVSTLPECRDGKLFFTIKHNSISLGDIVSGKFEVVASCDCGGSVEKTVLPLWWMLKLVDSLLHLNSKQVSSLNRWLSLVSRGRTLSVKEGPDLFGFGNVSPDGDAIIGRNGFYFLGQGSNRVVELYENSFPNIPPRWEMLFSSRSDWLNSIGIDYIQIIIPEKSSVYYFYTPFKCNGFSSLLSELHEKLAECENFLFPFFGSTNTDEVFLKADSHLSTYGAIYIVRALLKKFDFDFNVLKFTTVKKLVSGDLGKKFEGDHREIIDIVETLRFDNLELTPELVVSIDPVERGHKGIRRVWKCSGAPVNKRVVVFGNSFFERGGMSNQLSWWFSRIFSEFHFVWSPSFDGRYVAECSPDVVIGQTIERFLRVVPEDSI